MADEHKEMSGQERRRVFNELGVIRNLLKIARDNERVDTVRNAKFDQIARDNDFFHSSDIAWLWRQIGHEARPPVQSDERPKEKIGIRWSKVVVCIIMIVAIVCAVRYLVEYEETQHEYGSEQEIVGIIIATVVTCLSTFSWFYVVFLPNYYENKDENVTKKTGNDPKRNKTRYRKCNERVAWICMQMCSCDCLEFIGCWMCDYPEYILYEMMLLRRVLVSGLLGLSTFDVDIFVGKVAVVIITGLLCCECVVIWFEKCYSSELQKEGDPPITFARRLSRFDSMKRMEWKQYGKGLGVDAELELLSVKDEDVNDSENQTEDKEEKENNIDSKPLISKEAGKENQTVT